MTATPAGVRLGLLAAIPDGMLVACSWHGALFLPDDGGCVGGPCIGAALLPWPVHVVGDALVTGPPPQG